MTLPPAGHTFNDGLRHYFRRSAAIKLAGRSAPSDGTYIQIFLRALDLRGHDFKKLCTIRRVAIMADSDADHLLPLLFVLGFFT